MKALMNNARLPVLVISVIALASALLDAGQMGPRPIDGAGALSVEITTPQQTIDRADVADQLLQHGISREQAAQRLASLSPAEIHEAAQQIEQANAGGDAIGSGRRRAADRAARALILVVIGKL
ncbi:MAG: PA2779 family protein [Planctomycetota bacterium]